MSRNRFALNISKRGRNAALGKDDDLTFDSSKRTVKVNLIKRPNHTDAISYTFSEEPPTGRHILIKFEHGYDYTPATMFYISTPPFNTEGEPKKFYKMPFTAALYFTDGSLATYEGAADRKYIYIMYTRTVDPPSVQGQTVFFKYNILDVQGME